MHNVLKLLNRSTSQDEKEIIQSYLKEITARTVDDIIATDAIEATADIFFRKTQRAIQQATGDWDKSHDPSHKQPLHNRLRPVKQVLDHFGQTILRFCDPSKLNDAALARMSQMV